MTSFQNEPKFDNIFSLSSRTKDPLPVVTFVLRVGKKQIAMMVACLTCLWDSGATDIINKIKHTKHYERRIMFNKVEHSTAVGLYYTAHDVKVPFFMTEFSSSKIIEHRFRVENNKVESDIGYDMIIGHDLMVQLGLLVGFKHQVLQWDDITLSMKEPRNLLG